MVIPQAVRVNKVIHSTGCGFTIREDSVSIDAQLHGVENTMIDLLERPEYMHALAEKLTDIYVDKIRQYDMLDLFEGAQDSLHCTAAYTEDLPSGTFDGVRYHTKDVCCISRCCFGISASDMVFRAGLPVFLYRSCSISYGNAYGQYKEDR